MQIDTILTKDALTKIKALVLKSFSTLEYCNFQYGCAALSKALFEPILSCSHQVPSLQGSRAEGESFCGLGLRSYVGYICFSPLEFRVCLPSACAALGSLGLGWRGMEGLISSSQAPQSFQVPRTYER